MIAMGRSISMNSTVCGNMWLIGRIPSVATISIMMEVSTKMNCQEVCLVSKQERILMHKLWSLKNFWKLRCWCCVFAFNVSCFRSSRPEVFLRKVVLKTFSTFKGEHPFLSAISIKLQSSFIEITLQHGCSPVKLLYIFRTPLGDYFWCLC